jgi:DNA helicase-2/ATP-dependent DNA helicase PcrA
MDEFENLQGFLEHISLVMDNEKAAEADAVNIMTLHSAKGLEFDTVFLPGWEEGVFPNQRTLDDQGRAGLEEERRLAHVGLTRARKRAKIYFATNRRMHGLWQTNIPSRFLDELPEAHVEVTESQSGFGGYAGYGASRFDAATSFGSNYTTPGWQRAQGRRDRGGGSGGFDEADATDYDADHTAQTNRGGDRRLTDLSPEGRGRAAPDLVGASEGEGVRTSRPRTSPRLPLTIEGELVAKSTGTISAFTLGDRVFHQKFGNGNITAIDGNKLTIDFDKAGQKRVVDSFVERV